MDLFHFALFFPSAFTSHVWLRTSQWKNAQMRSWKNWRESCSKKRWKQSVLKYNFKHICVYISDVFSFRISFIQIWDGILLKIRLDIVCVYIYIPLCVGIYSNEYRSLYPRKEPISKQHWLSLKYGDILLKLRFGILFLSWSEVLHPHILFLPPLITGDCVLR